MVASQYQDVQFLRTQFGLFYPAQKEIKPTLKKVFGQSLMFVY